MAKVINFLEKIEEAKRVHKGKYDYSKAVYRRWDIPITIICPVHGEFKQILNHHVTGSGCPKCGKISSSEKMSLTTEEFIKRAKEIHGDKYDYSKVKYINNHTKVCIICPKHGEFWQLPSNHISGAGCPKCKRRKSKLEKMVENFLINENIKYEGQKILNG